jgi:ParB family chromosome partitioning protein
MVKRAPRRRPRKAKPGTKGFGPAECRLDQPTGAAAEAAEAIAKAGGCVVGSYKEPLGGHPLLLSILPIDAVEPTPFQRDLSDAHHKRLADVINKTGRFLDPIIAVVAPKGGFWTPNGRHRLEAMRRLAARGESRPGSHALRSSAPHAIAQVDCSGAETSRLKEFEIPS